MSCLVKPVNLPFPVAEMAEMNRIQYEMEYTAGISQRMRIPEMLKVGPQGHEEPVVGPQGLPHSVIMQVPERIVIAGQCMSVCYFGQPFDTQTHPVMRSCCETERCALVKMKQNIFKCADISVHTQKGSEVVFCHS